MVSALLRLCTAPSCTGLQANCASALGIRSQGVTDVLAQSSEQMIIGSIAVGTNDALVMIDINEEGGGETHLGELLLSCCQNCRGETAGSWAWEPEAQ